jgi:hypothetical protein
MSLKSLTCCDSLSCFVDQDLTAYLGPWNFIPIHPDSLDSLDSRGEWTSWWWVQSCIPWSSIPQAWSWAKSASGTRAWRRECTKLLQTCIIYANIIYVIWQENMFWMILMWTRRINPNKSANPKASASFVFIQSLYWDRTAITAWRRPEYWLKQPWTLGFQPFASVDANPDLFLQSLPQSNPNIYIFINMLDSICQ